MITIEFSQSEIDRLHRGRFDHSDKHIRIKMEVLYLKSQSLPHGKICQLMRMSKTTLTNYLNEYIENGLDNLSGRNGYRPVSELKSHIAQIKKDFEAQPPQTVNEAGSRIEKLTGIKRKPTQIRNLLKSIGMRILKVGTIPAKANPEKQKKFKEDELEPCLENAKKGKRAVFFVDAAHFVHKAFLGFVWCFQRLFIKAPSGRKRFNVLGALNAVTHQMITVTNDSYINALSVCELLEKIASQVTDVPITLVLDNAKYQKCDIVKTCAEKLDIQLLYLPTYSPNLNLIERFWKFIKKQCLYSKYYEKFTQFKNAITHCISENFLIGKMDELESLLVLNFQTFEKV